MDVDICAEAVADAGGVAKAADADAVVGASVGAGSDSRRRSVSLSRLSNDDFKLHVWN